ncbi:TonB-dependent receptor [Pustulibacterium marinum]|uniref:TonB-dependent receptor n=1 Tax=Pustulibacterium marinum TaxID=1224947 RepID=UPI0015A69BA2|nr:carboxypeptidase-like regulatory domain-containing protein [Pustulibacterium marinum]
MILHLFSFISWSQSGNNTISLADALHSIEAKTAIKFNYIEQEIQHITLSYIPNGAITHIIDDLEKQTQLVFTKVSDHYYVIQTKKEIVNASCFLVLDSLHKQPLANVQIYFKESLSTIFTDQTGRFCIPNMTKDELVLSLLGYQDLTLSVQTLLKKPATEILMQPKLLELEEVEVVQLLTRGIQQQRNGSYKVHSKNTGLLPGLTEPDVLQTLQQLPGAISLDETISNISLRGGTNDQNLILWNGIRMYQSGHFFGLISAFNPNLSQSITVFKNATPAQYGQSVSGTVLIDTHLENNLANENSIGVNLLNVDFNTSFNTSKNTIWQFSGRRSTTNFYQSPTYKSYLKRIFQNTTITNLFLDETVAYQSTEDFYFYDLTAQVHQKIGNTSSLQINSIFIGNDLDVNQTITENTTQTTENSTLKQHTLAANMTFSKQWNTKLATSLTGHFNTYQIQSHNLFIENVRELAQESTVEDKGFILQNTYKQNSNVTYTVGYELSDITMNNLNKDNTMVLNNERQNLTTHSLFSQATAQLQKLYFTAGLRQSYYSSLKRYYLEPRFLVRYTPNTNISVALQGEMKSQATHQVTQQEEDFLGLEKKRWTLANETDLPVSYSHQISTSIRFTNNHWLLTAEPFFKNVQHINSKAQGFNNQYEFENALGMYTVYGIEFLAQKQWNTITAWINYQYNHNKYSFKDLHHTSFTSNQEVPHALRSGFIYDDKQWQFGIGATYTSGRYYTQPASRVPVYDANQNLVISYENVNTSQLNNYLQFNSSASFTHSLSKRLTIKLGVSCLNLFNSSETIHKNYRINSQNSTIQEINVSALERTFNGFIRLYF